MIEIIGFLVLIHYDFLFEVIGFLILIHNDFQVVLFMVIFFWIMKSTLCDHIFVHDCNHDFNHFLFSSGEILIIVLNFLYIFIFFFLFFILFFILFCKPRAFWQVSRATLNHERQSRDTEITSPSRDKDWVSKRASSCAGDPGSCPPVILLGSGIKQ